MSTSSRVEELKQKFDENPRRYFAPLANELRKTGDLAQAIAICRAHLPTQPGHVSGHIVLAQALYEAGEIGDARSEFAAAVELDPENLIALRYMGDIARSTGDIAEASGWYQRVLDADPRNYEIARLLRELESLPNDSGERGAPIAAAEAPVEDPAEPSLSVDAAAAHDDRPDASDIAVAPDELEPTPAAQAATERDTSGPVGTSALESFAPDTDDAFFTSGDQADAFALATKPSPTHEDRSGEPAIDPSELDALWEEEAPSASQLSDYEAAPEQWFDETDDGSHEEGETSGVAAAGDRRGPTPTAEIEALFDTSEVVDHVAQQRTAEAPVQSGTIVDDVDAAFRAPHALLAQDSPSDDRPSAEMSPPEQASGGAMEPAPASAQSDDRVSARSESEDDSSVRQAMVQTPPAVTHEEAGEEPSDSTDPHVGRAPSFTAPVAESSVPFVTETLAELYLQQGFTEEALSIYRQLLARNPSDATLRNRIAALEGGRDVEGAAPQPASRPLANEKAAQSVRTFFGRLARRAPGGRSPATPEAPRSHDEKGAGVFDGATSEADTRAARNLSTAFSRDPSPATARPSRPADRDLSLDHLFREAPPPDAGPVTIDEFYAPPESVPAASPTSPADDDERAADIRQFTSWLEGLKKK